MKAKRVETFDDWKDFFRQWQNDINYDSTLFSSVLEDYEFAETFPEPSHQEIEFGEFVDAQKWNDLSELCRVILPVVRSSPGRVDDFQKIVQRK